MRWLNWRRAARPTALPSVEEIARGLVSSIGAEMDAALSYGVPYRQIMPVIWARECPRWEAAHGREAAAAASRLLDRCGPVHFLTPYGAQLAGLPWPHPTQRKRP